MSERVPMEGVLQFLCPRCAEVLEVRLGVTSVNGLRCQEAAERHRPHLVEFIAEAPDIHAHFWGHMVRNHGPNPHPYMPPQTFVWVKPGGTP